MVLKLVRRFRDLAGKPLAECVGELMGPPAEVERPLVTKSEAACRSSRRTCSLWGTPYGISCRQAAGIAQQVDGWQGENPQPGGVPRNGRTLPPWRSSGSRTTRTGCT